MKESLFCRGCCSQTYGLPVKSLRITCFVTAEKTDEKFSNSLENSSNFSVNFYEIHTFWCLSLRSPMIASLTFKAASLTNSGSWRVNSHETSTLIVKPFIPRKHILTSVLLNLAQLIQVIKSLCKIKILVHHLYFFQMKSKLKEC